MEAFDWQWQESLLNEMLDSLVEQGFYIWDDAIPQALCLALLNEVQQLEQEGEMYKAGIGRGDDHQLKSDVRRDKIKWLDGNTTSQILYLKMMAELQFQINRALFLGLFEYEAHFALYDKGDFYKRHRDSFKGAANRILTTVLYLNPEWDKQWGGELLLYPDDDQQQTVLASVTPQIGRLAIFMSENLPHEVLPTQQPRVSIAGWFRCNNSLGGQIDPAK
ncbi:2OG-Fe(II) oxygenase [Thiomicrorhabdus sp. 6S3-12]|uniref:2OG-Fe(II) oxygenase n=1 Tax=Thiomicrorhabdus sp. 6S3-12 TaxID=2819681 RepID=UPI001AAC94C7|nr:2OG-Fe(II) oxygenase [Thiomicrorhabdus sp. 6S3-12]MBO1923698.1 2OG-Fe(II) oxygenase [Thiomicrorhabdus sp. 6S3-12]